MALHWQTPISVALHSNDCRQRGQTCKEYVTEEGIWLIYLFFNSYKVSNLIFAVPDWRYTYAAPVDLAAFAVVEYPDL